MRRWEPFVQLVLARAREFYREPTALFWVYAFPLLLAVGLSAAFARSKPQAPIVDIENAPDAVAAEAVASRLRQNGFKAQVASPEVCRDHLRLAVSALVLVVRPQEIVYIYDDARADCILARWWTQAVLTRPESSPAMVEQTVDEPGNRYIDFLLPGLIATNIMGGGLFGVGFALVDMRVRKLFRRLMATPMRRDDFLLSLLSARLLFLLPGMAGLLAVGGFWFGVPIRGSLLLIACVILLGALAFSGLGLFIGSRTEKTETMSSLVNLAMLPQYVLSGVFFSSKRFPDAVQPFVQALPLTQLIDALRAVMLEGAGIEQVWISLAILAGWSALTFTLALWWFRWR